MATTFALCAVFVPVAFMGGIIGKFFYPFGITVVVAVLVSLFVSFTLDPMLSASGRTRRRAPEATCRSSAMRSAPPTAAWTCCTVYERLIRWAFSGRRYRCWCRRCRLRPRLRRADGRRDKASPRRWRWATLTPRGVVMAVPARQLRRGAIGLAPLVGSEFVPQTDQGFTQLALRMPVGSSLERTDAKVRQVEAIVLAMPEVKTCPPGWAARASATRPG
jgi:multidrug efflux pump subunit AcrB